MAGTSAAAATVPMARVDPVSCMTSHASAISDMAVPSWDPALPASNVPNRRSLMVPPISKQPPLTILS